jgi:hypothetical protein
VNYITIFIESPILSSVVCTTLGWSVVCCPSVALGLSFCTC